MADLFYYYKKIEHFFGNMKFAVIVIVLYAIALAYGTTLESLHGAEYANRLVYKSGPFMLIQLCMFLSIVFATFNRLPPRKRLYGFYTIHTGLIVIFIGAFISLRSAIDGSIVLLPNMSNSEFLTNREQLIIRPNAHESEKEIRVNLPYTARERQLDFRVGEVKLLRYLPFSDHTVTWHQDTARREQQSTHYQVFNEFVFEQFVLTHHDQSNLQRTLQLGPLSLHYMPKNLLQCFRDMKTDYIIWNRDTGSCEAANIKVLTHRGVAQEDELVQIEFEGKNYLFQPEMSPFNIGADMRFDRLSPVRLFNRNLFESTPHIFLFGQALSYFNRQEEKWLHYDFELNQDIQLPWMDLRIRAIKNTTSEYPLLDLAYMKPIQESGEVIEGNMQAVEVQIGQDVFWVDSTRPTEYTHPAGHVMSFELGHMRLRLPYDMTLDRFQMDYDPGTTNAATYESFVTVFMGDEGSQQHHIYMNNPLRQQDFTFYQASYFELSPGNYGSVLSVNYDPGRPFKYSGSVLLIVGSAWHFYLNRNRRKRKKEIHNISENTEV